MICRNCGAGLEAGRIDTTLGMATCSHCGSLHDIPSANNRTTNTEQSNSHTPMHRKERAEVALPDRFKVRKGADSMEVSWSTGSPFHGLVLFIIASVSVYMALTSGMQFVLIASAGLYYMAAAKAVNKHRIRVDSARLQVTQGPLPWPGTRKLAASDIKQLYATEQQVRQNHDKTGTNATINTQIRKSYKLSASTRTNGSIALLRGLGDPNQALWLEQELERLLGITNRHVAGSYAG